MKLLFFLFIFFTLTVFSQQDSANYQLLWEVKSPDKKFTSYIFGSLHSNDSRFFNFPDSLYLALNQSETVVLETDVTALFSDVDVRLSDFSLKAIPKEKTYSSSKKATQTSYGSEDGRPQFLDAYFQQIGNCSDQKVVFLESFEEQTKALTVLQKETKSYSFQGLLFSQEKFNNAYLSGNVALISKMLKSQLASIPNAYEALISKRNSLMSRKLDSIFKLNNAFCVVGSGHLSGNDGLLLLLQSKGFSVRKMNAKYNETCLKEKEKIQNKNQLIHDEKKWNYSISFSGKALREENNSQMSLRFCELGQGNTYIVNTFRNEYYLTDCSVEMVDNLEFTPIFSHEEDGTESVEGLFFDAVYGYQWKKIIQKDKIAYEMICFGGNKFMHSNRPKQFFSKLIIY